MKKIFLGLSFLMGLLVSAQYNSSQGWVNQYSDYGYSENENYYFPEDYYYEYPQDYYDDGYYIDQYRDYQLSIDRVNWNRFFREFRLNRNQISLIIDLNRQFSSYYIWSSYYRMNPKRWWYDRFYALERILGPQIFMVFQNRYYNGYHPVAYYNSYWYDYYQPRYYVMPAYRYVNVNVYKINRYDYHRNVGNQYGWNQPRNSHDPGGFKEDRENSNGGFRNLQNNNSSGFRTQSNQGGLRSENNAGVRSNTHSGVRQVTPQRSKEMQQTPRSNRSVPNYRSPSTRSESANTISEGSGSRSMNQNGVRNSQQNQRNESSGQRSSSNSRSGGGFR